MDDLPESIPVEYIKGIPNFITARKTIEDMKRREIVTAAAENRPFGRFGIASIVALADRLLRL